MNPRPEPHRQPISEHVSAQSLAHAALDGMLAHVCVIDETGTVLFVNRAWREFSHANGGDIAGTAEGSNYLLACDRAGGDEFTDAKTFSTQLRQVLSGERDTFEMEYPCHAPTALGWFSASVSRLPTPGPVRVVVAHQPVTERRLAAARQVQAQRMQLLGTLAGGLAHDFNNVLGAVLGNSAIALGALKTDHPAHSAVQRIGAAGERARQLVRRILGFARGVPQPPQLQALQPLVEETVAMLRLSVPAGKALVLSPIDQALWAHVDSTDLQQALMNLVHNAWQALMGRPGGQVQIGLEAPAPVPAAGAGEPRMAHLWVRDDGCGMSETLLGRIFEPFFTTRGFGEGTGLGLVQVQQAAARMQARLTVESTPGTGSTFHLWIPVIEPPQPAESPQPRAEVLDTLKPATDTAPFAAPRPTSARPAGPLRVLLVDDDEVMGLTVGALLEQAGHAVTDCRSGPQALRCLADPMLALDLMITDQTMPEMSGLELCRLARALRPSLPLILVSGSLDDAIRLELNTLWLTAAVAKEDVGHALLPAVSTLLATPTQATRAA